MGISPFDSTNPVLGSKRKYEKVDFHGSKNCKAHSLKGNWAMSDLVGADIDEDYKKYLANFDPNGNRVNDDASYNDPHYEIFLNSLTVHENSFVLQANERTGLAEPLMYDVRDGRLDELDPGNWRGMDAEIGGSIGDDEPVSRGGCELDSSQVFGGLGKEQRHLLVQDDTRAELAGSNPLGKRACLVGVHGNGGNTSSAGKYNTDVRSERRKSQFLEKSRNFTKGEKLEAGVDVDNKNDTRTEPTGSNPLEKRACLVDEHGNGGNSASAEKCDTDVRSERRKSRILKRLSLFAKGEKLVAGVNVDSKNDTMAEPASSNPLGKRACLVNEHGNGDNSVPAGECNSDMQREKCKSQILKKSRKVAKGGNLKASVNVDKNDDAFDEAYLKCINSLSYDGKNLVLKYKNARPVVYESDEHQPNAKRNNNTCIMKGSKTRLPAIAEGSDVIVMGDGKRHSNGTSTSHSLFREELMEILRKPYDEAEHKRLEQIINARKPVERNMDLRNGRDQAYAIQKDGKSYLDYHYDFCRKLYAAKRGHEELNLMRGFFFWLQHLTRDGAFKPWLDGACLAL